MPFQYSRGLGKHKPRTAISTVEHIAWRDTVMASFIGLGYLICILIAQGDVSPRQDLAELPMPKVKCLPKDLAGALRSHLHDSQYSFVQDYLEATLYPKPHFFFFLSFFAAFPPSIAGCEGPAPPIPPSIACIADISGIPGGSAPPPGAPPVPCISAIMSLKKFSLTPPPLIAGE